jgi:hypothetical protein
VSTQADGTKTYSLTTAQLCGLQLKAGEQSGTLHVDVTSSEGTSSIDTTDDIAVTVISNPPKLTVVDGGIGEPGPDNQSSNLGWCFVTPSVPGDTVSLTIAGLPAGASVSATDGNGKVVSPGTHNPDGSFTLTESQAFEVNTSPLFYIFAPLVTLPSGTVVADLTLTGTETNPTTGVQTSSAPFSFVYDTVADATPHVTVNLTQGLTDSAGQPLPFHLDEATTVPLDISFSPIDPLGDSITIKGLPSDATLSNGTKNSSDGSWTLTSDELVGLTLTTGEPTPTTVTSGIPLPSAVDFTVQVTTSLGNSFFSGGGTHPLWVYAVAPTLSAPDSLMVTEGVPIALGISETPADPLDPVVISITGVPTGDSLSDSAGDTLTPSGGVYNLDPTQLDGLTLTPGVEAAPTATLTVTALNTASKTHNLVTGGPAGPGGLYEAISTKTIALSLAGVAPTLTVANNSLPVKEEKSVALGISETPFAPVDPISLTITGVPSDASLSAGTPNPDGSWTLTPAQLPGLTLKAGEVTTATLTVTATNTGGATPASAPTQTITLNVDPIAPVLGIADHSRSVSAGGTVPLGISVTPFNHNDVVSVTISGVPLDASLSAGTYDGGGFWTLTPAQLDGLTLTATAGDVTTTPDTLIVTAINNTEGKKASTSQGIALTVNQLTAPTLTIANNALAVNEDGDGSVALGIGATPFDPSDVVSVTIAGVPPDASLSAGTKNGDGSWTLTPAQLVGLTLTAGEVPTTPATLTVTATNTEGGQEASSASQTIALTVNPVAPTLSAPASLTVNEDGSVALGISVTPFDPNDTVSVTIAGVPSDASLSAGTKNNDGSWTLTPAQLAGLMLNAGESEPRPELTVAATNTEGVAASSAPQTIALTVNPVAPTLSAPASLSVSQGLPVALGISASPFDPLDTVSVAVSGIPSDAILMSGNTELAVTGGSITLTPAQLSGLTLTAGTVTTAALTVTAISEDALGASFSATKTIELDAPVLSISPFDGLLDISATPYKLGDPVSVTISGIPTAVSLSYLQEPGGVVTPLTPTNGSITLTPSQLVGLQFAVGSTTNLPLTPLTVTATETTGGTQVSSAPQELLLTGNSTPTSVGVTVLAPQSGDPVTETRLDVAASGPFYPIAGRFGQVTELRLTGVPTDVTLQVPTAGWTLSGPTLDGATDDYTLTNNTGRLSPTAEVDVLAPSGQSTNFNLGITAVATGAGGATTQATTSQNIEIDHSTVLDNPTFSSVNQSIWGAGSAFVKSFDNSLFVTLTKAAHTTVLGYNVSGTGLVNAGLQSDLNLNSGSFNGTLPFNVTLDETYNKTTDTLQIDPTASQSPTGGSFSTTGPGGSYTLDFILDSLAKLSISGPGLVGTVRTTVPLDKTIPLLDWNSTNLKHTFPLPAGIGTGTIQWPQVDTIGNNLTSGAISSKGSSLLVGADINPIALLAKVLPEANLLQGSFLSGHINYTLLQATVAPSINLKENFRLTASLPTATLTGGSVNEPLSFNTNTPLVIDNASSQDPGLGFNLSMTPDATLQNGISLAGQLQLVLQALAGNVTALNKTESFGPLVTKSTTIQLGQTPSVYNKTFAVAFQPQNVAVHAPSS